MIVACLVSMSPQARFSRETFAANRTVERAIFRPLNLGVVIPEVLLKVR